MRKVLIFCLFFLCLSVANAQFYYPIQQDASDFSKRRLLVQILEEDEKTIKQLKSKKDHNKAELDDYRKLIDQHNVWLKLAVTKFWKINSAIEFKTQKEINNMLKDAKTMREYAVLNIGWKNEYTYKDKAAYPVEVYSMVAFVAEATDRHLDDLKRGPTQKTDYIFKVAFPTDALNLSDFIFAVQQFNYHIPNAASTGQVQERYRTLTYIPPFNKAGYEIIKKKTLLIPIESIPEDKREEIKIAYEYPFELAGTRLYEEAVEHQFARYVYFTLAWSDRHSNFVYYVVNASEGIILAELGHKPTDLEFMHHTLEGHSLNTTSGEKTTGTYKVKIGISMDNIIQLEHILVPKK